MSRDDSMIRTKLVPTTHHPYQFETRSRQQGLNVESAHSHTSELRSPLAERPSHVWPTDMPENFAQIDNEHRVPESSRNLQHEDVSDGTHDSPLIQSEGSENGGSMFHSASNVAIHGGNFTTQQWHGPQTIINYNILDRLEFSKDHAFTTSYSANIPDNVSTNPKGKARSSSASIFQTDPSRVSRRSNSVYENHLSLKGRGHPLWIPAPNTCLPDHYIEKGISIGDVGLITADGGFDFLFNICLPADNPIHEGELPDNFAPISPPLGKRDIREFREFQRGRYLTSCVRVKGNGNMFKSGLQFEPTSPDGAILAMPEGAYLQELNNVSIFRRHIAVHAIDWYRFANGPRGREVKNGELRVVVGSDKTTSWAMGAFAGVSSPSDLQLQFIANKGPTKKNLEAYEWKYEGIADVKTGPDELDSMQPSQAEISPLPRNQCLFVRTLRVTLSQQSWDQVQQEVSPTLPPLFRLSAFGDNVECLAVDPMMLTARGMVRARMPWEKKVLRAFRLSAKSYIPEKSYTYPESDSAKIPQHRFLPAASSVHVEPRPPVIPETWKQVPDVPDLRDLTELLSNFLFRKFPSARMVITSDRDWQSALTLLLQNQTLHLNKREEFPDKDNFNIKFMDAVNHLNNTHCDDLKGIAYFEPKVVSTGAPQLSSMAENIRSGRETPENILFGSPKPMSQAHRTEIIDRLIDTLNATEADVFSQSGGLVFLSGHKTHALTLEFSISDRMAGSTPTQSIVSIDELRRRLNGSSSRARSVRRLGHALYAQFMETHIQDDLDEAIWWFLEAVELTPKNHYLYLEVVITLCCALYFRLQLLGLEDDKHALRAALKLERDIDCNAAIQSAKNQINSLIDTLSGWVFV